MSGPYTVPAQPPGLDLLLIVTREIDGSVKDLVVVAGVFYPVIDKRGVALESGPFG